MDRLGAGIVTATKHKVDVRQRASRVNGVLACLALALGVLEVLACVTLLLELHISTRLRIKVESVSYRSGSCKRGHGGERDDDGSDGQLHLG